MAYNLELAKRLAAQMKGLPFVEKKMFGGVGFLIHGNMACGVNKDSMIVRCRPEKHTALLKRKGARPFDLSHRPAIGWLMVDAEGLKTDAQLAAWLKEGVNFALSLPPK